METIKTNNMETKVYGIDSSKLFDSIELLSLQEHTITNQQFIEIAEEHGLVWSLNGFTHDYNIDDISHSVYIRII